jgi:periplasmic mercuric ion binding protein
MTLKTALASLFVSLASGAAALAADATVQLSNVHLCCGSCVKGVDSVIATVSGAQATANKDEGTVDIAAADTATVQKAVDALVAAGYFGVSNNSDIKVDAAISAKDEIVQSLHITRVHLCCPKCVTAVNRALGTVAGVTGNTAAKGVSSFDVTGNFSAKAVIEALRAEGLSGTAAE